MDYKIYQVKKIPLRLKFFSVIALAYIIGLFMNPGFFAQAAAATGRMFIKVLPVLVLAFLVQWLINYLVKGGRMQRILARARGVKGWISVIIAGILVGGPPYVLFPLLKEVKAAGLSDALLTVFLYNRNVKIPFVPVSIYYFGLTFTIIVSILLIIFSVFSGILIQLFLPFKDIQPGGKRRA